MTEELTIKYMNMNNKKLMIINIALVAESNEILQHIDDDARMQKNDKMPKYDWKRENNFRGMYEDNISQNKDELTRVIFKTFSAHRCVFRFVYIL